MSERSTRLVALTELADDMRHANVRRMRFYPDGGIEELEIEPRGVDVNTEYPAPEFNLDAADLDAAAEPKPAGECSHGDCHEPNGFPYAPQFCQAHGLAQFGVRS